MNKPESGQEGWKRMFMVSSERLEEIRELYESLGYRVKFNKPRVDEFREECASCAVKICEECYVVYVWKGEV